MRRLHTKDLRFRLPAVVIVPALLLAACQDPVGPPTHAAVRLAVDPELLSILDGMKGAVTTRGDVSLDDDAFIDGHGALPPGWRCDGCTSDDRAGVVLRLQDDLDVDDDAFVDGVPPVLRDPTIGDATFSEFGPTHWDEIAARATSTVGEFGEQIRLRPGPADRSDRFGPHKRPDGGCDVDHPLNFGSNDPDDPCYDHFPIVRVRGEVELKGRGYVQGLFIMEFNPAGEGAELDLEGDGLVFAGVILGRGCIEVEDESAVYGAIFLDGRPFNESLCGDDDPVQLEDEGEVHWSRPVVARTSEQTGIVDGGGPPPPGPGDVGPLFGASSASSVNPASLFRIDPATGQATLIGPMGIPGGDQRISALDMDPFSGRLYGIKGSACRGALLVTLDPATGAGAVVGPIRGQGFDATPGQPGGCPGGADGLAFDADGTLYVSGWFGGGPPGGKIMRVDPRTAEVLELRPLPPGFGDRRGRRIHLAGLGMDPGGTLWASRGGSAQGRIDTVDPATGRVTMDLLLRDPDGGPDSDATISSLTFAPDGTLLASLAFENLLATIDPSTGVLTRVGPYGDEVNRIAGLATVPRTIAGLLGRYWLREAAAGRGPAVVRDDRPEPVDLAIDYAGPMSWTAVDGHRGLRSDAFRHDGIVAGSAAGSKYDRALHRATQATFVSVAAWEDPPYVQRIAGFQSARGRRVAMFQTGSNGWPSVELRTRRRPRIDVRWPRDLDDGVRRVFHIVYDAGADSPDRRIRLYVNGVDQGPGEPRRPDAFPERGDGLDLDVRDLQLTLMNRAGRSSRAMKGTVFYYAVYDIALTPREIAGNAAALLRDDGIE